jgi:hypothetical protein
MAAIVGGVVGLGLSEIRSPRYQAIAVLGIGIDYGRTQRLNLLTEKKALDRVRGLLLSDDTLQGAISLMDDSVEGDEELSDMSRLRERVRIGEKGERWELSVISAQPELAAIAANAWADSALTELETAVGHAWRVAELQGVIFELGCRLESRQLESAAAVWICEEGSAPLDLEQIGAEALEEATLSRGVLPAISFSMLERAFPPTHPVLWGRGLMALSGALIGLLLGAAWVAGRRG